MKVRQIKANVNRRKPVAFTFSASVKMEDGHWTRVTQTHWCRSGFPEFKIKLGPASYYALGNPVLKRRKQV